MMTFNTVSGIPDTPIVFTSGNWQYLWVGWTMSAWPTQVVGVWKAQWVPEAPPKGDEFYRWVTNFAGMAYPDLEKQAETRKALLLAMLVTKCADVEEEERRLTNAKQDEEAGPDYGCGCSRC